MWLSHSGSRDHTLLIPGTTAQETGGNRHCGIAQHTLIAAVPNDRIVTDFFLADAIFYDRARNCGNHFPNEYSARGRSYLKNQGYTTIIKGRRQIVMDF
jgi:hypothetical protein